MNDKLFLLSVDEYIKGMEMPKGCATCPYCDRAWNKPKCKAKSIQGRFMEQRLNLDRTRQKWCPLVPVPQHGDLIDRKELLKHEHQHYEYLSDEFYVTVRDIESAPTIIEANEGAEE